MERELIKKEPSNNPHETPILFVHGAWHTAWYWEENFLPYFAENGYISYALSLRGHGKSEGKKKLRWTSLNDFADDVAHVVDIIGKEPVIIGHSMGGAITQKYLENRNVPGAVLIASVPPAGVIPFVARIICRHPISFLKANLTLNLYHIINAPKRAKSLFFSADISDAIFEKCYAQLQGESYRVLLDLMCLNLRPVSEFMSQNWD